MRYTIKEETRRKMSLSKKMAGIRPPSRKGIPCSEKQRAIVSQKLKGRKFSIESIAKRVASRKATYDRIGRKTNSNTLLRMSKDYSIWRTSVFQRDGFTCIWCGKKGGRLNADHIKPFSKYPALRFAIDNGRTLCEPCHRKTDTFGAKSITK